MYIVHTLFLLHFQYGHSLNSPPFTIPGVKAFLSERLSQDPLQKLFGCQRQRGGTSENPNVSEFCKNTQALRVINSVCGRGNCRGNKRALNMDKENSLKEGILT